MGRDASSDVAHALCLCTQTKVCVFAGVVPPLGFVHHGRRLPLLPALEPVGVYTRLLATAVVWLLQHQHLVDETVVVVLYPFFVTAVQPCRMLKVHYHVIL